MGHVGGSHAIRREDRTIYHLSEKKLGPSRLLKIGSATARAEFSLPCGTGAHVVGSAPSLRPKKAVH